MEVVREYIHQFCGINGIPLDYAVRTKLLPGNYFNDPYINYAKLDEEMIARAPIFELVTSGNP